MFPGFIILSKGGTGASQQWLGLKEDDSGDWRWADGSTTCVETPGTGCWYPGGPKYDSYYIIQLSAIIHSNMTCSFNFFSSYGKKD